MKKEEDNKSGWMIYFFLDLGSNLGVEFSITGMPTFSPMIVNLPLCHPCHSLCRRCHSNDH